MIKPSILKNRIQHYEWGTRGKLAFIPDLIGIQAENDKPYAELWLGAHPTSPSQINISGDFIGVMELINNHPIEVLGKKVVERFGASLPFLLKILSAEQALSIQAHPNIQQAKQLHHLDPVHYPDENHKPEIAIALDRLTALVGFLNPSELIKRLALYAEVQTFTGLTSAIDRSEMRESNSGLIKQFYSGIIQKAQTEPHSYAQLIELIESSILQRSGQISEQERLFLELKNRYPSSDIGLIMVLFMNLVHLESGQALFTSAGIPHAYISGNLIECMTNSDNVVRVGLTGKYKDVTALLEILDYSPNPYKIYKPRSDKGVTTYQTPVDEFYVINICLQNKEQKTISTNDKVQIGIVLSGQIDLIWNRDEILSLKKGESVLIPACIDKYILRSRNKSEIYFATVN